nr:E141 [uncultured bacterium]
MQNILSVLWPSFLVAGIAEGIFFTLIDPQELYLFGEPVHFSSLTTYSIGFFCFWVICAASSMATCYLLHTAQEFKGADQKT